MNQRLLAQRAWDSIPPGAQKALGRVLARPLMAYGRRTRRGSEFVDGYLSGLKGIEIGAAAHNAYYLDAINVDRYDSDDTPYKEAERRWAHRPVPVDIVASGDALPFADDSYDFVFSSHVIEHIPDPIRALHEWVRVAARYVVAVVPHRDRTFDSDRELTPVDELLRRHREGFSSDEDRHWSVWTCESFISMCEAAGFSLVDHQDPDDKMGNGFTVVIDAGTKPRAASDDPAPGG